MSTFDDRTVAQPLPYQDVQDAAVAARNQEALDADALEAKAVQLSDDVDSVTVDSVTLNVSDVTIAVDAAAYLDADVALTNADDRVGLVTANGVTFSSATPAKAIIVGDTVVGVSAGTSVITATFRGTASTGVTVTVS